MSDAPLPPFPSAQTPAEAPLWQLDQIQRWMHAVITHPEGVEAALDSDDARGQIDLPAGSVEQIVSPSKNCTSIQRLEVYANAYYARLLECLRDEFPALFHAVGEEIFDGLAFGYLQAYPSTSYTLSELARRFPQFLEETRPTDVDDAASPSWPDFLIDLARLERTYSEVFDGPGGERLPRLDRQTIAALSPEDWTRARLVCVPSLRLLTLQFPVHEYATAVRKNEDPEFPDPRPTWLAVSRVDYVVRRWPLTRVQHQLLQSLLSGQPVGDAIQSAAEMALADSPDLERLAVEIRDWFEEWSAAGFFEKIDVDDVPPCR